MSLDRIDQQRSVALGPALLVLSLIAALGLSGCQSEVPPPVVFSVATVGTDEPTVERPNEQFAQCVNAQTEFHTIFAEAARRTDEVPDYIAINHVGCVMDPGPSRVFVEAVQGCYAEVPEFHPSPLIPMANFEFAYCLHDEGLPVVLNPYNGDIEYWRCEGTPEGILSASGGNSPKTPEEMAAVAACSIKVPEYTAPHD